MWAEGPSSSPRRGFTPIMGNSSVFLTPSVECGELVDRLPWPPPRMMDSWKQIWISSWSNLMPPALVHLLFTNRLDFNRTRPPWSWEAPPPPSPSRTCSNCARAAAHQASLSAPVLVQPHTLRPHLPHPELGGCSEGGRHPFVNCMGGSEVDFY